MLCIYHIADHDGKGSGAVVRSVYPEIELLGINHDMKIPYEEIEKHDKIIICDYALPVDYMFELNKTKDVTWIDHHASVIEEYEQKMLTGDYEAIKGLRRSGTAAMVLCWEYYYPNKPVPEGVKLLGLNDIFDLRDPRVRPFEFAFQSLGMNKPDDEIWVKLFNDELDIKAIVEKGEAILSWIKMRNYRLVRSIAFESEINGLKCICANMPQGYSDFFDSVDNIEDYDVRINFFMNNHNKWNLSFYTYKEGIDVSKLAASMGGGGHVKAAGASNLPELPEFLRKGKSGK